MTPTAGVAARPPARRPLTPTRALEYAVGAQLWAAAGGLEVALRRRPLPALLAAGARASRSPAVSWFPAGRGGLTDDRLDRLAVRAGAWWRGRRGCLPRTLLRAWLAVTAGQDAAIVLGVRREVAVPFTAHAWLEIDGRVRGEPTDPEAEFQRIARYRLAAPRAPS